MEVIATLNLNLNETNELARILEAVPDELPAKLTGFASAALREYVSMFLGQRVFSRGSDILEHRLFLLIEEALGNTIPDEQEVSHLFQTTATESRSLIRSVMSKYQYQLKTAIETSLQEIVKSAKQTQKGYPFLIVVNSQNLIDELNRLLAEIDGTLPPVIKQRGNVSTYVIQPSSHARLKKYLRIP
jgi:hypothetical protein